MVLQNCKDEVVSGSCSETYLTSSPDVSDIISVKVEDVADVQLREDLVPTEFLIIKNENEVSCVFLYIVVCERRP